MITYMKNIELVSFELFDFKQNFSLFRINIALF